VLIITIIVGNRFLTVCSLMNLVHTNVNVDALNYIIS